MMNLRAGPVNTPTQLAEQQHYVFRHISVGNYANVYFSIPKLTANQTLSDFDSKNIHRSTACSLLRAALQAIKVTKGKTSDTADDMDREIAVLTRIARKGHPNIVSLRESDAADRNKCWYTLELLTGNTLGKYCDLLASFRMQQYNAPASLAPIAFGWHVIFQLTEALLALHFGDKDGKQSRSWPMYSHNDTHINNMLFRSGSGKFRNYPDVVLIDFGRVRKLSSEANPVEFFETQRNDMKVAITMIVNRGFDFAQDLQALSDEIADLDIQKGVDNNRILKTWMRDLRARAFRERERLYTPLHPDVVNHFQQQETMGDAELWEQSFSKRSVDRRSSVEHSKSQFRK